MNDMMRRLAGLVAVGLLGYAAGMALGDGPWQITTLEDGYGFGNYTSIAILPSGYPAISYYDRVDGDLEYAEFDGTEWHGTTVDSAGQVGEWNSLAIQPGGQPAISYQDRTAKCLKYAWRDGNGKWNVQQLVNGTGEVDMATSLEILPTGEIAVSYASGPFCGSVLNCCWFDGSQWYNEIVDQSGDVGGFSNVAFLSSGYPVISYFDYATADLKCARRDGSGWHTWTVDAEYVGWWCSLRVFPPQHPTMPGWVGISYRDGGTQDLKYAWFDGTRWQSTTVDADGDTGSGTSLTILPLDRSQYSFDPTRSDLSGQPAISYGGPEGLKLAWLDKQGAWHRVALGLAVNWWQQTGLAVPTTGPWANEPVITFFRDYDLCFTRHDAFGWRSTNLRQARDVGKHTSLVVPGTGPFGGEPLLAYSEFYPAYNPMCARRGPGGNWESAKVGGGWCDYSSLALLPSGQPAMSTHHQNTLYYLWHEGNDWQTGWRQVALDDDRWWTSLAVNPCSGQPAITYNHFDDLNYIELVGSEPSEPNNWQKTVVDSEGMVGYWSDVVFLPADHPTLPCRPAVAYMKGDPDNDLKFAWRDSGGQWHTTVVDSDGRVGEYTSMAILPTGQPAVSYWDGTNNVLKFAWHTGDDFNTGWHNTVVTGGGGWTSLTILVSAQPGISFVGPGCVLRYAWHEGDDFSAGWHSMSIESNCAEWTSLALGASGQPQVSYFGGTGWDLKHGQALLGDVNCDGVVDFGDINPFVLALLAQPPAFSAYYEVYPNCPRHLGDINGDGRVDFGDINPFVELLTQP